MTTVRIPPLDPPYDAAAAAELARWMPPGSPLEPLALFRTLARDLPLAEAMLPLGRFLLSRRFALDRRLREIAIDRVTARSGCEYEWGVHVAVYAEAVGLDAARVEATVLGAAGDPSWAADEALVVRLVDELHDTGRVSDGLWEPLAERFGPEGCLELLVLVGWYHLISFVANGAQVAREPWAARFPSPA